MQPQQLHASEVLSSGFRLSWPPLLTADSGYYVLELVPSGKLATTRRQQLPGNATSWTWTDLDPDTDYEVSLLPESNVHLLRPQHVRVRTLQGEAGALVGGQGGTGRPLLHATILFLRRGGRARTHRHLACEAAQPPRKLGPRAWPGLRSRLPCTARTSAGRVPRARGGASRPEQHYRPGPDALHHLPGDCDCRLPLRPPEGAVG